MAEKVIPYVILEPRIKGDTFDEVEFETLDEVGDPVPITGANILIQFRKDSKTGAVTLETTELDGITITDDANGLFKLNKFKCEWTPAKYYWDAQVTFANTDIKTSGEGHVIILQDVSYKKTV